MKIYSEYLKTDLVLTLVLEHRSGAIIRIVVVYLCVIIGHELGIMNRVIGELTGSPTLPCMLRLNIMHEACGRGTARVDINYSTHSLVPTHCHTYTHSHTLTLTCTLTLHSIHTYTHSHSLMYIYIRSIYISSKGLSLSWSR